MARTKLALFLGLLLLAASSPADAQDRAAEGAQPDVTVVHPGDNGFAELMRAGDPSLEDETTRLGKLMTAVYNGSATLSDRRAAVGSPEFRAAMAQMREALDFTLIAPTFRTADDLWAFSAPLRRLTRFLMCEEEVQFADGKPLAAIDGFAEALRMSGRVKSWNAAGLFIGSTIETLSMRPIVHHLDQLSARDCDRLFGLLRAELKAPDPAIEGLRNQKELGRLEIDRAILTMELPTGELGEDGKLSYDPFSSLTPAERQDIMQRRASNPESLATLRNDADQRLAALYDDVAERLAGYPNREPRESEADDSQATADENFVDRFVLSFTEIGTTGANALIEREVSSRARLQILGVHAAILRRRWETGVVPKDLTELHLGPLATDPFTGQPLRYTRVDDTHYTLASNGRPPRGDNGQILPGAKRTPFTLDMRGF